MEMLQAGIAWPGDDLSDVPLDSLLELVPDPTPHEVAEALSFYGGDQWPKGIVLEREAAGRPTLVFNRLPGIVKRICSKSCRELLPDEYQRIITAVVRINRDAQRFYNHAYSSLAESHRRPQVVMAEEQIEKTENGWTYVKPPRRMHRRWVVRALDRLTRWIDPKA